LAQKTVSVLQHHRKLVNILRSMNTSSLTYAAVLPDLISLLRWQFASNPSDVHWTAAKRILQYFNGTVNEGMFSWQQ